MENNKINIQITEDIPYDLPFNWSWVKLGDINIKKSQSINPNLYPNETFELYSVPSFENNEPEVIEGKEIKSGKQIVFPNDVLISKINPRINRVWIVKEKTDFRQIASTEWIIVKSPLQISSRYLMYFFRSMYFRNLLTSNVSGVGGSLTRARPKTVEEFPVVIAPIAEQKRIVAKLDALMEKVNSCKERLEKIPDILKRFRQSVLAAAVSGQILKGFKNEPKEVSLADVCMLDVGYAFKSEEFEKQGIRLLRGENIEPGKLRWLDTRYFPEEKLQKYKHLYINEGDVILAMDRPLISTGLKIARAIKDDLPCVLVQRVCRFVSKGYITDAFLYYLLNQSNFIKHLHGEQTGTQIPHISAKQILSFSFLLPTLDEQEQIVSQVDHLFRLIDSIEDRYVAAKAQIDQLPQVILSKAFRGELVPQDPKDEPASILIERIQQEKSGKGKITKRVIQQELFAE